MGESNSETISELLGPVPEWLKRKLAETGPAWSFSEGGSPPKARKARLAMRAALKLAEGGENLWWFGHDVDASAILLLDQARLMEIEARDLGSVLSVGAGSIHIRERAG